MSFSVWNIFLLRELASFTLNNKHTNEWLQINTFVLIYFNVYISLQVLVEAYIKFSCRKFHASSVIIAATYFHEGRLMRFYTCLTEHAYLRTMSLHFFCQTKIFKLQFIFSYRSVFHKHIRPNTIFYAIYISFISIINVLRNIAGIREAGTSQNYFWWNGIKWKKTIYIRQKY